MSTVLQMKHPAVQLSMQYVRIINDRVRITAQVLLIDSPQHCLIIATDHYAL